MSNDGFLVGDACVVTPSGAPVGLSAMNVWSAKNAVVYFDPSYASPDELVVNSDVPSLLSNGDLLFVATRLNEGDNVQVQLTRCDSSNYPVRGLDALAPDVPTALALAAAVVLVWTAAFGFRMLRRALDTDEVDGDIE